MFVPRVGAAGPLVDPASAAGVDESFVEPNEVVGRGGEPSGGDAAVGGGGGAAMGASGQVTVGSDYDPAGRLVEKRVGDYVWSFGYDTEGRLKTATQDWQPVPWEAAERSTEVAYGYDAFGRRVRLEQTDWAARIEAGGNWTQSRTADLTYRFVYDGPNVVAEYVDEDGDTVVDRKRIYWNEPSIDQKIGFVDLDGDGNATVYYYVTDQVGSVLQVLDATGKLVEQYAYDAFGNLREGKCTLKSGFDNRYRFHGRERDPFTGQYYYRYRQYDPDLGRFTNPDHQVDLADRFGPCNYAFCQNNPLVYADPMGLWGVQVGGVNVGIGEPNLAFDTDVVSDGLMDASAVFVTATNWIPDLLTRGHVDCPEAAEEVRRLEAVAHERGDVTAKLGYASMAMGANLYTIAMGGQLIGAVGGYAAPLMEGTAVAEGMSVVLAPNVVMLAGVAVTGYTGVRAYEEFAAGNSVRAGNYAAEAVASGIGAGYAGYETFRPPRAPAPALATGEDLKVGNPTERLSDGSLSSKSGTSAAPKRLSNKKLSRLREQRLKGKLESKFGEENVLRERILLNSSGEKVIDPTTGTGRRIDFIVVDQNGVAKFSIEGTSRNQAQHAGKASQLFKEATIRAAGGTLVRHPVTGKLIDVSGTPTRVVGLEPLF